MRPSAEELARESQAGSCASFDQLVGRFQRPLYQFLKLRARSEADAEELAHETFVRAWTHIDTYDSRWRFSTWLYTIARRETASYYRREARRVDGVVGTNADARMAFDPRPEPVQTMCADERHKRIWELASRVLGDDSFTALWLRYAEDLTPREIGHSLERPATAVRVLLFRARRTLSHHLQDEVERCQVEDPIGVEHAMRGA
jgi:RNA polymerase sigma-70 factor (ECF subfamily)